MTETLHPSENMDIWNSVCETDPQYTKGVDTRGGFTSVCAQSQLQAATKLFGPYGMGWGVNNIRYQFVDVDKPTTVGKRPKTQKDPEGDPGQVITVREYVEVIVEGELWYNHPKTGAQCSFPVQTNIRYREGDDWYKKAVTDMTTKGLSKLGFNADVFLGKFDDNKYVQEMNAKHSKIKDMMQGK